MKNTVRQNFYEEVRTNFPLRRAFYNETLFLVNSSLLSYYDNLIRNTTLVINTFSCSVLVGQEILVFQIFQYRNLESVWVFLYIESVLCIFSLDSVIPGQVRIKRSNSSYISKFTINLTDLKKNMSNDQQVRKQNFENRKTLIQSFFFKLECNFCQCMN